MSPHGRYVAIVASALVAACSRPEAPSPRGSASPSATRPEVGVGDRSPSFTAPDIDGRPTSIVAGKVHVIGFLATWSEPDKRSIPRLEELLLRHRAEGLIVLAISIDDDDSKDLVRPFFRQAGGTFPVVHDADHRISSLFRVPCSPTFYVVDQAGVVRFRHCGYHDGEAAEIEREVVTLLGRHP